MVATTTRKPRRGSMLPQPFTRTWTFNDPSHNPVQIDDLRDKWQYIPDENIKSLICADEQFLIMHRFLTRELRSKGNKAGHDDLRELGLSLRAGMIRTEVFLIGGIAEAALRAHAKSLSLPKLKEGATFKSLLDAWREHGQGDLLPIEKELDDLRLARNTIHLYVALKAAKEMGETFWRTVVEGEAKTVEIGEKVIGFLKLFRPSTREASFSATSPRL